MQARFSTAFPQRKTAAASGRRTRSPRATAAVMIAALATVSIAPIAAHAAPAPSDGFEIPDSAVVRPLGDIVQADCDNVVFPGCSPDIAGFMPYNTPGLGIPLGGIGAGSFMINQSGTFGPWYFGGSRSTSYEVRALPQAAFHVREKVGDGPVTTRTLAADGPDDATMPAVRSWEDPLPAWNTLDAGQAEYAALYPFGWMSYDDDLFASDIDLRFYSPIIAGEAERSSLPVAYFDVRISNDSTERTEVSTMFTMPNVGGHEWREPATIREGLTSHYREDPASGVRAVTLSSDADTNTPDAFRSEWTIAADLADGQSFSYATSWDAAGTGADVYDTFTDDGRLDDGPLDDSASAGAIAVSATLEPGETTTIPFVLTWDFPQVSFADDNSVWMRRYTEFYGAETTPRNDYVPGSYPFHQSFAIAKDALTGRDDALRDVLAWWEPIVLDERVPGALGAAAMNQLANVTFHTNIWENGLVSNTVPVTKNGERIGTALADTHNYFGTDSNSGGVSTLGQGGEIGIYSYSVYADLFPFIERDRMRAKVEQIMTSDDGDPGDFDVIASTDPAAYGLGGNPFITWNPHNQSSNDATPGAGLDPGPGTMSFLDRASANIFRMYDYAQRHADDDFLEFAYPAMNRVFDLLQATVPEDSVLPEPTSQSKPQPGNVQQMANVYNAMPTDRFDSYTSAFYLLTLETMIAAGERVGESSEKLDGWRGQLDAAKAKFEEVFWNEEQGYYRYTLPQQGADTVMLATFQAQYLAERSGLDDLVNQDRYLRHLTSMLLLVSGTNGPKLVGLPEGATSYPLVGPLGTVYETNVVPGAVFSAASVYASAGIRGGDAGLVTAGLDMAGATSAQLWEVPANGFEFNTPYLYSSTDPSRWIYPSFENNLAIWQLIDVLRRDREPDPDPAYSLTVSPSPIRPGEEITIRGTGFPPGAQIDLTAESDPRTIGTVPVDVEGELTTSWRVPPDMPGGSHRVLAATTDGDVVATAAFVVVAAEPGELPDDASASPSPNRGRDGSEGPLAATGNDATAAVWLGAAAAAALLMGAALLSMRRRA